jgi:hypothetical protein
VLRLAADENFNSDIVRGLIRRKPDVDIVRVQDVGLSGAEDPRSHLLVRYKRKEVVYNGQYQGSAPSLKGMSGGGIWQVSLRGEMRPHESPALAAMIIEQPQTY